ncbi:MAG TPA: helix-turn-helix domain-containing protein [Pseudonocardiaceae bacterium]|jgi:DNA-binding HxlR family transcriptional regulator|nr:helix-turn-helix domain-containing protein [Pseudonocardiaceae bacterium]
MNEVDHPSEVCSVARTVALFGDRWSFLILRDIGNRVSRFDELIGHLGIARDVLSRRLGTLVDHGLVAKRPYREAGRRERVEYRLTDAGRDFVPVLVALMSWGDEHLPGPGGAPVTLSHEGCGEPVGLELRCAAGHVVRPGREIRRELNAAAVAGAGV